MKNCLIRISRYAGIVLLLFLVTTNITGCKDDELNPVDMGYSCIEELEYQEAVDTFLMALETEKDTRYIYRGLGIAYIGLGQYNDAIESLLNALSLSSGIVNSMDYDINYYLATAYFKNGQTDEAIATYDSILALKPNDVDAIYFKGVLCASKERLEEAMTCFDKVISLEPNNYDRIIQIYTILQDNGYKETGQAYLQQALANETKKMTDYEKGQISFYLEDYESAKTYLEKARESEGYEAILLLGKTYEKLGDNNYAVSVYSSYTGTEEGAAEILNEMGLCKIAMNDYSGALQAFEDAMNIPDNGMAQILSFNEIVCYEYMGDFETARTLMESYVKKYPDDDKAKREFEFLKTR